MRRHDAARENLLESEKALQAYREEKGLINLSGSAQGPAGMQIGEVSQRLAEARARRMQLEGTYNMVSNTSNSDYSNVPSVANNPTARGAAPGSGRTEAGRRAVGDLAQPHQDAGSAVVAGVGPALSSQRQQRRSVARSMVQEYNLARQAEKSLETALTSATGGVQDVNL